MAVRATKEYLTAVAHNALDRYKCAFPTANDTWRKVWELDASLFVEAAAREKWPFDCPLTWEELCVVNNALVAVGYYRPNVAHAIERERRFFR